MSTFRVESVRLAAPFEKAFEYIAAAKNLPHWTHAFKAARDGQATIETPAGAAEVGLKVVASKLQGTIDWYMTFPDKSVASAFSRLVPEDKGHCIYSFILLAPPVPLERLEGALNDQVHTLRQELGELGTILSQP